MYFKTAFKYTDPNSQSPLATWDLQKSVSYDDSIGITFMEKGEEFIFPSKDKELAK